MSTLGFVVEDTGGGCQWLRRGRLAITSLDFRLPKKGQPCVLVTLDEHGDCDGGLPLNFPSLEEAFDYVEETSAIYSSVNQQPKD